MFSLFRSPLDFGKPSRMTLEQNESSTKEKLEAALARAASLSDETPTAVLDTARNLKAACNNFEEASRKLSQWLGENNFNDEARQVRRDRHKLVFGDARESLADLNGTLADMELDGVSSINCDSTCSMPHSDSGANLHNTYTASAREPSFNLMELNTQNPVPDQSSSEPSERQFELSSLATGGLPNLKYSQPSTTIITPPFTPIVNQTPNSNANFGSNVTFSPSFNSAIPPPSAVSAKVSTTTSGSNFDWTRMNEINKVVDAYESSHPHTYTQASTDHLRSTGAIPRSVSWHLPPPPSSKEKDFSLFSNNYLLKEPNFMSAELPVQPLRENIIGNGAPNHHTPPTRINVSHQGDRQYLISPEQDKIKPQERLDLQTRHLMRQDLLKGSSTKFNGEPQQFLAWKSNIQRRLSECEADSLDSIHILLANSSDRPKVMIQHFLSAGISDPDSTLRDIWWNLERRFATSGRISESLFLKLSKITPIKFDDVNKLEDILDLGKIILTNMLSCPELSVFNLQEGMRRIWEKLPEKFFTRWRARYARHEEETGVAPDFPLFLETLEKYVREVSHPSFLINSNTKATSSVRVLASSSDCLNSDRPYCKFHNKPGHHITTCHNFSKLSNGDRKQFVIKNKLCFLCFGEHFSSKCPDKDSIKCEKCQLNHNTVMHFDRNSDQSNLGNQSKKPNSDINSNVVPEVNNSCTELCGSKSLSRVCSKTLPVQLSMEGSDKILNCLAIIDEQSNASFCDNSVVTYFKLDPPKTDYRLSTMTNKRKISGSLVSDLVIRGLGYRNWINLPTLLTHPNLPDTRNEMASPDIVSAHPHIRHLADKFPIVDSSYEVMILIGVNAGELMRSKCHGAHFPFIHETELGFALVGPSCINSNERPPVSVKALRSCTTLDCEHSTSRMCFPSDNSKFHLEIDSPFSIRPDDDLPGLSREDVSFNCLMEEEVCVNEKGNLQLPLPLKPDVALPNNKCAVYARTRNSLDRLKKDSNKLQACLDVLGAYIKDGHVEQLPFPSEEPVRANYIPIFPVISKDKVRLVFDSSAVFNGGSLNEALMQGPDLNNALVGVLMRFRIGEVGITADIERMFHSFYVDPKDTDLLRFYWFRGNDPLNEIVPYRALVHIFGNKPSPAVANFALKFTTLHPEAVPLEQACSLIRDNFYVDDALFSTDSVFEAIKVLKEVLGMLGRYNIHLHKILSSHNEVMQAFPTSELAKVAENYDISPNDIESKTLGINWSATADTLSLCPKIPTRSFTKRGILAVLSAVYDPIGAASPLILKARLLFRKIVPSKYNKDNELGALDWDDPLPERFKSEWVKWTQSLDQIDLLKLPRCYKPRGFGQPVRTELHCFADASDDAIGLVIYIRQINANGDVAVGFVFGNSRVAPRAANTIPRLELCASVEVAKTTAKVIIELKLKIDCVRYYSDSKIVLGYLLNTEKRFSRYVTHRVNDVLKYSDVSQWSHIDGSLNMGDVASRPQTVESLLNANWLTGPNFLIDCTNPVDKQVEIAAHDLPEIKCNATSKLEQTDFFSNTICLKTTSWLRARSILSRVLTFVRKLKPGKDHIETKAGGTTLDEASLILIKEAQQNFSSSLEALSSGVLSARDPLSSLSPFLDPSGLLRVGGRLNDSSFPGDVKHPILLPSNHPVTLMILSEIHQKVKHQGRYITSGEVRMSGYHILHSSAVIKRFINQCITCRKLRGRCQEQMMADLPPDRLEHCPPFTNVGLDLFGPYLVHDGQTTRRTNATKKVWGLLLTCLSSRAIHIELLPYLDTSSLQLGLRRFYAIRGTCKRIRSDQGTNIIGARNQLVDMTTLQDDAKKLGVEWELNPPSASSWGGVWERKIGSVKRILECTLLQRGKSSLSRDELSTYLQECASIVNNTPLWECSSSPDDPAPITPANLITLRDHPNPPPPESFTSKDLLAYGKLRWRRVVYLCDQFWIRWQKHYVDILQRRNKWKKRVANLNVGDVVLVKRNAKRNEWPFGVVISVKHGRDDLVRSVIIKLSKKSNEGDRTLERSVRDVVVLVPAESESS